MGTYFFLQISEWGNPGGHRPRLGEQHVPPVPTIVTPLERCNQITTKGVHSILIESNNFVYLCFFLTGVFRPVKQMSLSGKSYDYYVDGGMLCNYPIHCYDGNTSFLRIVE